MGMIKFSEVDNIGVHWQNAIRVRLDFKAGLTTLLSNPMAATGRHMKPLDIEVFECRSDNYGVLVHDPETGLTAAIDAERFTPLAERAAARA